MFSQQPNDRYTSQYGTVNQSSIPATYSYGLDEAQKFNLYTQQVRIGLAEALAAPPNGVFVNPNSQQVAQTALNQLPPDSIVNPSSQTSQSTNTQNAKNITSNILKSIRTEPGQSAQTKATKDTPADYNTSLVNLQAYSKFQSNLFGQLPPLYETSPGVYAGQAVNQILQPTDIAIGLDAYGNIFGGPISSVILRRIDQLNGFGLTVNNNNYDALPNGGVPFGALGKPFIKDNFLVEYSIATNQINSARIFQFAGLPIYTYTGEGYNPVSNLSSTAINYTGPTYRLQNGMTGPTDRETQGLSLAVNGQTNRTLYLLRRQQPYYFQLLNPALDQTINYPGNPYDVANLAIFGGFYFTYDPVGGSDFNFINQINSRPNAVPIQPRTAAQSLILRPSGSITVFINNEWFDHMYYQSTSGPFMGGNVWIIGSV